MPFAHVPVKARRRVLEEARVVRDGAATRVNAGGRVGDNAYADMVFDTAEILAAEIRRITNMHIPPTSIRPFLWRAARVGEKYAYCK